MLIVTMRRVFLLKKIIPMFFALVCVCVFSTACFVIGQKVCATVDGEKVYSKDLEPYLRYVKMQVANTYDSSVENFWDTQIIDGDTARTFVYEMSFQELVRQMIITKLAKERGITLSESDQASIKSSKDSLTQQFGGDTESYKYALQQEGLSDEFLDSLITNGKYEELLYNKIIEENDEAKLRSFYENDMVLVKHILIQSVPTQNQGEGEAKALEEANRILALINEGGNFDDLVNEYSQDPGSTAYPSGYLVGQSSSFIEAFKEASLALQVDQVSGVVQTDYGYHIIKRYQHVGNEELFQQNLENIKSELVSKTINDKKNAATIERKEDVIKNLVDKIIKEPLPSPTPIPSSTVQVSPSPVPSPDTAGAPTTVPEVTAQ